MCLGYLRDAINLVFLSKYTHRVLHREEDAEAILYPLVHLPTDEPCHLKDTCQCMGTIGNDVIRGLARIGWSYVDQYSIL